MSMYGLVFGRGNPDSPSLLSLLGLTEEGVGRFRDAGVENGEIFIYTRNGGGNRRECWNAMCVNDDPEIPEADWESERCSCCACLTNYVLPKHPNFLRGEDDDFDCTYRTFYFSFPEEFAEGLRAIDSGEAWDPDKRWLDAIEAIKKP